jgi:integrase
MLTAQKIKSLKPAEKAYKVYDAEGLYIEVPPKGNKRWRFKYRINGKEKRISFGVFPDVGLKEARAKRDEARELVQAGTDPSVERKRVASADTFETVAREWVAMRVPVWSESHRKTTLQRLESYMFPQIGKMRIVEIEPLHVLDALRIIERRGAVEAARKTLGICSLVFRYAVATARIASDPCRDLRGALASRKKGHFGAVVDPAGAGALMRAIDGYTGAAVVRLALQFIALTFVRPGELRAAQWSEFDFKENVWLIPAEKMKMRQPHVVPLSRQALAVLNQAKQVSGGNPLYVFPSVRSRGDRQLSENTLLSALRALGYAQGQHTAHGFRAMASSLLNAQGWNADVIERQLAHTEKNKIRAAYHRTEYLDERREMMQAWADYLDSLRGIGEHC